jgi:hypothetical protein
MPRGLDPALAPELGLPGYPLFLKAMSQVPFVLAPEGNGVATHRAWEVMYVGSIAVIQEVNAMSDTQYRGLPVMMVKDWAEVTPLALSCYAVELFAKAVGLPLGGPGEPGGGLYSAGSAGSAGSSSQPSQQQISELLLELDPSGTLAGACAGPIASYAAAHRSSHTGFLSLEALNYEWWHEFISRHTERMAKAAGAAR